MNTHGTKNWRRGTGGARASAMLVLGMLAAGCTISRTEEHRFDIAPTTGLLAVDVENFRGKVELRADQRAEQAVVRATVHASRGMGDQAQAALDETHVSADLEEEGARAVLRVRTASPRENTGDHWVNLVLRVPRCQGVRIDNRGGLVMVVGASGGTAITNRLGAVEYRTDQPMTDPVTITTTDGDVYYQIPAESSGQFDLQTLDGKVWYRDRVQGTDRAYVVPGGHQSRLNEGTNPIALRTNRGNINIWVDKDPVAITRIVKTTPPDPQDLWFLQGSRRYTRNLPDDHPELMRDKGENRRIGGY